MVCIKVFIVLFEFFYIFENVQNKKVKADYMFLGDELEVCFQSWGCDGGDHHPHDKEQVLSWGNNLEERGCWWKERDS